MGKNKKINSTHYVESKLFFDKTKKDCLGCDMHNDCEELTMFFEKTKNMDDDNAKMMFDKIKTDKCKLGSFSLISNEDGSLFSHRTGRKTTITPDDLPSYFMKSHWGANVHYVSAKNVSDIKYSWIKENHIFKDSCLYIAYGDNKIDTEACRFGSTVVSYDEIVFEHNILEFLKYLETYSPEIVDKVEKVKKEIIKQLDWLLKNETDYMYEYIQRGETGKTLFEYFFNKNYLN